MKTILVVNPHAGRHQILGEVEEIRRMFEERGHAIEVAQTQNAQDAARTIDRALDLAPELLVCCGGDGTLNETADRVLAKGARVDLGYIPAGTTNDFASFLNIPKEPILAARAILEGRPKPLDVGRFGERTFIYIASFGAFTKASYSAEEGMKKTLGHFAYVLEGMKELSSLRPCPCRVETDEGQVYEGDFIFGGISNSTSIGGMVKLDPSEVAPADGLFELALVRNPETLGEFHRLMGSLLSGKYDETLIHFGHTRGARFTFPGAVPWSLDGEYAPGGRQARVSVCPQALRLYY